MWMLSQLDEFHDSTNQPSIMSAKINFWLGAKVRPLIADGNPTHWKIIHLICVLSCKYILNGIGFIYISLKMLAIIILPRTLNINSRNTIYNPCRRMVECPRTKIDMVRVYMNSACSHHQVSNRSNSTINLKNTSLHEEEEEEEEALCCFVALLPVMIQHTRI